VRSALVLLLGVVITPFLVVACSGGGGGAEKADVIPPLIRETFTVLPCPRQPVTTIDLEGCAEKALLQSNRKIDLRAERIFELLRANGPRAAFVRGEERWRSYRRTSCAAEASKFCWGKPGAVRLRSLRSSSRQDTSHRPRSDGTHSRSGIGRPPGPGFRNVPRTRSNQRDRHFQRLFTVHGRREPRSGGASLGGTVG
jgi:hypothetical protein